MAEALRAGENPLDDGGIVALVASSPEQREVLDQIGGLMSLLEGHGDVTMDRAGPASSRARSASAGCCANGAQNGQRRLARLLQQLIGLEAKLNQYEQGERFIAAVEAAGGPALLDRALGAARAPARRWPRSATPASWMRTGSPPSPAGVIPTVGAG